MSLLTSNNQFHSPPGTTDLHFYGEGSLHCCVMLITCRASESTGNDERVRKK